MMHPLVNKKDFDQALSELGISKKRWAKKKQFSSEWIRRVLHGERSPELEKEIIKAVKDGEKARKKRHNKRKLNIDTYGND